MAAAGLDRFVEAQAKAYADALAEIRAGHKRTHWMWFVFPQLTGLGTSPMAKHFAIANVAEAKAYLAHPVLGARLREITQAVLDSEVTSAHALFGSPDDVKLRSCATLFAHISPPESPFHRVLEKYFDGEPDKVTITLLERMDA